MRPKLRLTVVVALAALVGGLLLWRAALSAGWLPGSRSAGAAAQCPSPNAVPSAPAQAPAALNTAADYLAQGDYDFDRGNCDQALADYTRAIALNPDYAEAYNNRAYTYMAQANYASALPDLDRAIALRPDYVNALMNRGDIYNYYYNIDYDKAVADYDRVIQIDPTGTSVCGHRLLALNHGWNANVFLSIFIRRDVTAGCPDPGPGD